MPGTKIQTLREIILEEHRTGLLIERVFGPYARRSDASHSEIVGTLAGLHNEGLIDLLQIYDHETSKKPGSDFFLGMHLYCELIPRLSGPTDRLMALVRRLVLEGGDDLAATQPYGAFRTWCRENTARVDEVVALAAQGSEDAQALLSFALEAGAALDPRKYISLAIEVVRDGDGEQQLAGVVALSRINFSDEAAAASAAADALEAASLESSDQRLRMNALRAAFEIAIKTPSTLDVAERLLNAQGTNDAQAIHICAQLLAFSADSMAHEVLDALLQAVVAVDSANKGTVDQLDFGLRQLWVRGEHGRVTRTLEAILPRQGKALPLIQFDSLVHEMLRGDRSALEAVLVRWFLSGDFWLCEGISGAIARPGDQLELSIDFSGFGLNEREWGYLARKAVGFFILHPVTAASIIVSLLRAAPNHVQGELVDLLFDPVLINYYGSVRDYCERIRSDSTDRSATAVGSALTRQEEYLENLRSVGEVRELHPSERQRRAEWRRHSESMNDAYKAAQKKSILSTLATKRVMLYGNRAISYFEGPNKEKRRTELELNSISTTIEIPRVEIVDPVGLQYQLMIYRSERPVS